MFTKYFSSVFRTLLADYCVSLFLSKDKELVLLGTMASKVKELSFDTQVEPNPDPLQSVLSQAGPGYTASNKQSVNKDYKNDPEELRSIPESGGFTTLVGYQGHSFSSAFQSNKHE